MDTGAHRPRCFVGAKALIAVILLSVVGWAGESALAGERDAPAPEGNRWEFDRLMEDKLNRLFDQLRGVWQELPRYALPEVTEDGDIVIRRLPRRPEHWSPTPMDPEEMVDL